MAARVNIFINPRRRALRAHKAKCGFMRLIMSNPHDVQWRKHTGDVVKIESYGDTRPAFADPVELPALVNIDPVNEKKGKWSPDERNMSNIEILTETAVSLEISNRDRVSIDGELFSILTIHSPEGQGHEVFTTKITITTATETDVHG